jgi:hypothetical protein
LKNVILTFLLLLVVSIAWSSPDHKVGRSRHHAAHAAGGRHGRKHAVAISHKRGNRRHSARQQNEEQQANEIRYSAENIVPQQPQPQEGQVKSDNSLLGKYCSVLGIMPAAMGNFALYNFIDQWMGVNYRYGGSDKKGVDCSAFVQHLYAAVFNVNMVRTAFEQFNFCKLVFESDKLKEGDLVFFRIRHRKISHVGIYLANNYFVHASVTGGVMISSLNDPYWKKYFAGAGTIAKDAACVSGF